MCYLIVTNDEELVEIARERGAGVFAAEKAAEGLQTVEVRETKPGIMTPYEILRHLGVKSNNKGYHYLKYLAEKCKMEPEYRAKAITKDIYPECAKRFDTTSSRVERAIRHALVISFESNPQAYSEVFGGRFVRVPTNTEFLGLVSEYFANNK